MTALAILCTIVKTRYGGSNACGVIFMHEGAIKRDNRVSRWNTEVEAFDRALSFCSCLALAYWIHNE